MKITRRSLPQLALPGDGQREVVHWDDEVPGLGVRILKSGVRSWVVRWRVGTRQRFKTLGAVGGITPDMARSTAGKIIAKARLGQDAGAEIEQARQEAGDTLIRLIERYLNDAKSRLRPRSYEALERHLRLHAKPLHSKSVTSVSQRQIAELLDELARTRGPVAANRARGSLSALWAWAMKRGLAAANPVALTGTVANEKARERALTLEELRDVWAAAGDGTFGQVIKLLILSGARRDEMGGLRWSEVDATGVTLSSDRVKNGRTHRLPLPPVAMEIITARPRVGEVVFSQRAERFAMNGPHKNILDRTIAKLRAARAGIENPTAKELAQHALKGWRLHDLRRSWATIVAERDIAAPHIIEAVLNHASGHQRGIGGVYNRAKYEVQARLALQRWANLLLEQEPAKVIALRPSA